MLNHADLPVPTYRLQEPGIFVPDPAELWFPPDDTQPFAVDIFDQTLAAFLAGESRYTTPRELWWYSTVASFSAGSQSNTPFVFELMSVEFDAQGNQIPSVHQEKAINGPNIFGTALHPFILPHPKYFGAGTEIVCRVSNLQNAPNIVQIVLNCYLRDFPQ